jgi:hypothetical protein
LIRAGRKARRRRLRALSEDRMIALAFRWIKMEFIFRLRYFYATDAKKFDNPNPVRVV